MRAFVLAAGLGIRLGPLGEIVPKALLPLGGVPMVRFALDRLGRAGVSEAVVNLHHRADMVRAALGESVCGVKILYSHEPEILGTAGGLKNAEDFLREGGGSFFVLNADILSGADLGAALARHEEGGFLATLILRASADAEKYGLLTVDEAGRLRRFLRASAPGEGGGATREAMFTGQSVMSPALLDHIPAGRPCGISEEVYPPLIESGAPVGGFLTEAYWADVGAPAMYLDATEDLIAGRHVPAIDWPAGEDMLVEGPPLPWGEGLLRPPVLIGEGVSLKSGATAGPFAVLGSGATLGEGVSAENSVIFPGGRVSDAVSLERCIVGPAAFAAPEGGKRFFESVFAGESSEPISF